MTNEFKPGDKVTFRYPMTALGLPDYTRHRGQQVTLDRPVLVEEYNNEGDQMWKIFADDGWIGIAYESELEPLRKDKS